MLLYLKDKPKLATNYSSGEKKRYFKFFSNISATEDRIFMKFETQAYNREVDHQKKFGKDLCTYARTQRKNVHPRVSKVRI